jgi:hypothetical protein
MNHDQLVSTVGAQDIEFFEKHPSRTYRVRPAHALEIYEFRHRYVVDETHFQPAIIVKHYHHNGYQFLSRMLVGAPKDVDLYAVSEDLAQQLFEPTRH